MLTRIISKFTWTWFMESCIEPYHVIFVSMLCDELVTRSWFAALKYFTDFRVLGGCRCCCFHSLKFGPAHVRVQTLPMGQQHFKKVTQFHSTSPNTTCLLTAQISARHILLQPLGFKHSWRKANNVNNIIVVSWFWLQRTDNHRPLIEEYLVSLWQRKDFVYLTWH